MLRRLVIFIAIVAGLAALADRAVAHAAGNATAEQIRVHEGLKEDPEVEFRGFPFVTQAVKGRFEAVDVTASGVVVGGLTIDRLDVHLEGVKVNLSKALKGRVAAVPIRNGRAALTVRYADLQQYLTKRPGNIRIAVHDDQPVVVTTFGLPTGGTVEVEGTPRVTVTDTTVRVTVTDVRAQSGTLPATLRAQAAARASFTVTLADLPFGIRLTGARLTPTALVLDATASGLVVDLRR